MAARFVIEVQPLFIRNGFQHFFACVPLYQPKSLLFKPKWIWNNIPDVIRDGIVQLALDEPELLLYGLKSAACQVRGNLGNAGCPDLPIEGIGLDAIQASKLEPPDGPFSFAGSGWPDRFTHAPRCERGRRCRRREDSGRARAGCRWIFPDCPTASPRGGHRPTSPCRPARSDRDRRSHPARSRRNHWSGWCPSRS